MIADCILSSNNSKVKVECDGALSLHTLYVPSSIIYVHEIAEPYNEMSKSSQASSFFTCTFSCLAGSSTSRLMTILLGHNRRDSFDIGLLFAIHIDAESLGTRSLKKKMIYQIRKELVASLHKWCKCITC